MKDESLRRLKRIQTVAKIFRFFCQLGMVILIACALMTIFNPAEMRGGFGNFRVEKLKPEYLWLKRPLVFFMLSVMAVFVWVSYRLFTLYSKGVIFSDANVRYIKGLGYWMIGAWAMSILFQLLYFLVEVDRLVFTFTVDGYFFGGVLVLLLAWITEEGKKLEEEQTLTV